MIDKILGFTSKFFMYTCLALGPISATLAVANSEFGSAGIDLSVTIVSAVVLIRRAIIDHD